MTDARGPAARAAAGARGQISVDGIGADRALWFGVEDVVVDPPDSVSGQLQRGRGAGALRAARSPREALAVVVDCVCRDPRWDHQVEDRALYYARLIAGLEWPLDGVAGHLRSPADAADRDEWRTGLAIGVLGVLVRAGREDALALLREYVTEGQNWRWALDELCVSASPDALDGLAAVVLGRFTDQELAGEVMRDWGPWDQWAATWPRVRAALAEHDRQVKYAAAERQRMAAMAAGLEAAPSGELAARVRSRGPIGRIAALELGRRADPVLLDLAEELLPDRPSRFVPGLIPALLRFPSSEVAERARTWCRQDRPYADVGVWILAERGDARDAPILLADLDACLAARDWSGAVQPIEGIGRLAIPGAAPMLSRAWAETAYSYLRPRALTALLAIAPGTAAALAEEGLWDCEELTRQRAAEAVSITSTSRARLAQLAGDPLESETVSAASARRLA